MKSILYTGKVSNLSGQHGSIADVANDRCNAFRYLRNFKQAGVGGWLQRIACDLGSELLQPQA